jgi:DNA-binding sugar fermentation-stimulating protein
MVSTRSGKRTLAAAALSSADPPPKKTAATKKTSTSTKKTSTPAKKSIKASPKKASPKKASPKKKVQVDSYYSSATSASDPLLVLPSECIEASLICRPSKRNRSPYVADVQILGDNNRIAICHMPNLDMGGKCVAAGTKLWIVPLRDKKGELVGPDAVSPKYGTPKCEFTTRLVRVDESELHSNYTPTWVGGHPSLGETLAEELLARHVQGISTIPDMGPVTSVKNQVMIGPHTRADFMLNTTATTTDDNNTKPVHRQRIVEVKTVVDTDYCASWPLPERCKCVFVSQDAPSEYQRMALFPWGQSNQKGPDGEKVVSTRAIKHVRELTQLVQEGIYDATILFLVIRGDAQVFRPNQEACPSFARYLQEAQNAGVQLLAKRVRWDEVDVGMCHDDKWLDVVFAGETK